MNINIVFNDAPYWIEFQNIQYKKPVFHRETLELIFVIKGELTVLSDESSIVLKEGEFISINAGIVHLLKGKKDTYITSVYIDLNYYKEKYPHIHGHSFYCLYQEDDTDDFELYRVIRNYFIRLMYIEHLQIPDKHEVGTEICDTLIDILINQVMDREFIKNRVSFLKKMDRERLFSMTQFMAENYSRQGLTLADIAKHENLSTTRLSHFWKSITNISFMDTIGMYRFNEAKRLLMEGQLSVSEITEKCGYSDEKYLYKVFKQTYNMTPGEFREEHKEKMKEPDYYEPQIITEIYDILIGYSGRYYKKLHDFSFLEDTPAKVEEEIKLNDLYVIITSLNQTDNDVEKIHDSTALVNLGLNSGIRFKGDEISLNWEYIYAIVQIATISFAYCSIVIEMELMDADKWNETLVTINEELWPRWGEKITATIHLLITSKSYEQYDKAQELVKIMKDSKYFIDARSVLSI